MKLSNTIKTVTFLAIASALSFIKANESGDKKTFGVAIDYLFWQALEDDLQYGVSIPGGIPPGGLGFATQFSPINQKFKPGSGVRVGARYYVGSTWDLGLSWTHFKKSSFGSVTGAPSSVVATGVFTLVENNLGSQASSDWRLKFNTIDLECGREISPMPSISVRPHIGLKGARINQLQTVQYGGVPSFTTTQVNRTNNFWAVGPRAGLDAKWNAWRGLSLIAGVSSALIYGKFDIDSRFLLANDAVSLSPLYHDRLYRVRPTSQMLLGLGFAHSICDFDFDLTAAYELQYWWNQWQNLPSPATLNAGVLTHGDLMTQGLTLRLGFGF
jgi:Legionella pneumophila major outer membrane protein precursor